MVTVELSFNTGNVCTTFCPAKKEKKGLLLKDRKINKLKKKTLHFFSYITEIDT